MNPTLEICNTIFYSYFLINGNREGIHSKSFIIIGIKKRKVFDTNYSVKKVYY